MLDPLLRQPLDKLPLPIQVILRMGVYQALFCDQVTFPAMVHTSVDLAKRHGHAGTAKLVNAVLHRVPRSLDQVKLPSQTDQERDYLSIRHSIPRWILDQWIEDDGLEAARALCEACGQPAPTTLRANLLKTSANNLITGLSNAGYPASKQTTVPEEITIAGNLPPIRSKLFRAGHCLLQDPASMLPPHLLEPNHGDHVLDLCAAPGGKTTHIAELAQGRAHITAMDIQPARLDLLKENRDRLGSPGIHMLCGDGQTPPLRPGFDRILVDAPCSGLGTLRRHPELKWRIQPEDLDEFAQTQEALLRSAIGLCKNTGIIVYAVCTQTHKETEHVASSILSTEPVNLENGPQWLAPWKTKQGTYRTNPAQDGLDGFFLMRLRKSP